MLSSLMGIDEVVKNAKADVPCMADTVIYKTTKTGATQMWKQEIDGFGSYRTVSGQVDGKQVVSAWTKCVVTNEGRANERNVMEQAEFEVNANYSKKLTKDYHLTLDAIDEGSHILPCMLAQSYDKALLRKNPPVLNKCYSQRKMDGMRCITDKNGMWSRQGKPVLSAPHIFEALKPAFEKYPNLILDGELYAHQLNFCEIMSIFKKLKPDTDDLEKSKQFGQYYLYDLSMIGDTYTFSQRYKDLTNIVESLSNPYLVLVPTDKIKSKEHLDELYGQYLSENFEGQIIREDMPYEGSRTWSLLKRKTFMDAEFELVDLEEGAGNWSGKAKRAVLKLPDGRLFGAGITGTMAFTADILKNKEKYIGKKTTVNFFQYTPDGVPLFPRVKELDRMDI